MGGPLSESLVICWGCSLTSQGGLPEGGRRTSIDLAERGAEVAVAGEAKFEAELRQVFILPEKIQRSCEPQTQLIAIQRLTFYLLEDLREIDRGAAYFSGDFGQRPSSRQIARQHELSPVHHPL